MPETIPCIDADTIRLLGQAKKGKARKFAMISRGVNIKRLIVFRKGAFKTQCQAIKKEGHKGEPSWGVVSGDGQDLTFYLSMEDGFDAPPMRDQLLKKFVVEEAQLKVNAAFKIVAELPAVSETDDDDAGEATPAETEPDPTAFMARLKSLKPDIEKVKAQNGAASEKIQKFVDAAADFGRDKEFDKGLRVLDEVEKLLKEALAAPPAAKPAPPAAKPKAPAQPKAAPAAPAAQPAAPPPKPAAPAAPEVKVQPKPVPSPPPAQAKSAPAPEAKPAPAAPAAPTEASPAERDARQKVIADAYRDLPEPVKFTTLDAAAGKAAKVTPDRRDTIEALEAYEGLVGEAQQWLRSEDASEHRDAATAVEKLRDAAIAERDAARAAIAAAAALKAKMAEEFKQRMVALMPAIKEAQAPGSPVAEEVAKLFKQAQDQGKAKEFEAGNATLDSLEGVLKAAAEAAARSASAAAYRSIAESWSAARQGTIDGMRQLAAHLKSLKHEAADAIAAIVLDVAGQVPDGLSPALKALHDATVAGDATKATDLKKACQLGIDECRAFLAANAEPIEGCEKNPFGVGVAIRAPIESALTKIAGGVAD